MDPLEAIDTEMDTVRAEYWREISPPVDLNVAEGWRQGELDESGDAAVLGDPLTGPQTAGEDLRGGGGGPLQHEVRIVHTNGQNVSNPSAHFSLQFGDCRRRRLGNFIILIVVIVLVPGVGSGKRYAGVHFLFNGLSVGLRDDSLHNTLQVFSLLERHRPDSRPEQWPGPSQCRRHGHGR